MSERIIPFPFQDKKINNGEKTPLVDRLLEESKTVDKWQGILGVVTAAVNPIAGAAMIGYSIVSHEVTRGELQRRRENRRAKQVLRQSAVSQKELSRVA